MKKAGVVAIALVIAAGAFFAACGGGGDDGDKQDNKTAAASKTVSKTTARSTGTAGAGETPGAEGTAGGTGTTPGAGATGGAGGGTPVPGATQGAGQTAPAGGGTTPAAAVTLSPSNPFLVGAPTPSSTELELTSPDNGVDPELVGGDPSAPPEVVTDLPPVPQGATIDPPTIAPVNVSGGEIEYIIDLNASEPGIQSNRTVKVGDVFRVGVVITNVAADSGGVTAFGFDLFYDLATIVAPTIENGSSLARNPDINEAALGGVAADWSCTPPAPNGDADEPGGYFGDGDPATGQAVVGCYTGGGGNGTGTLVLATVTFQAVAPGTTQLRMGEDERTTTVVSSLFTNYADCGFQTPVNCRTASVTVTE